MESDAVQYTTTSDGFSIAYAVKGEGTPLVFMPRPFNHLTILSQVASNYAALTALEARFRLIRYDSRGQGLSTRGLPDEVSIDHYALDLEAVVHNLRLDQFVLFGPLGFGRVALHYASQHPERVKALILWNPLSRDTDTRSSMQIDLPLESWDLFLETHAHLVYPLEDPALIKPKLAEATNSADRVAYGRVQRRVEPEVTLFDIQAPTLVLAAKSGSWAFATGVHGTCRIVYGDIDASLTGVPDPTVSGTVTGGLAGTVNATVHGQEELGSQTILDLSRIHHGCRRNCRWQADDQGRRHLDARRGPGQHRPDVHQVRYRGRRRRICRCWRNAD